MAYTQDEKSTGLDLLTDLTITQSDLHIVGDVSDAGRAKAITQNLLEDYIANSDNFIDELTNNTNFQTEVNNFVTGVGSSLEIEENGTSVETSVSKINFISSGGVVTNPTTGEVEVNLTSLGASGLGVGGTLIDSSTTTRSIAKNIVGTTETTLYTVSIPGGTLGTKNAIRTTVMFDDSLSLNNGAQATLRVKYGGTTIGSILLESSGATVTAGYTMKLENIILEAGTTNSQKSFTKLTLSQDNIIFQSTAPQISHNGDGSEYTTSSVDSSINQNLVVTVQYNATANSLIVSEGIIIENISEGGLQTKKVTLTNTNINGMYATPYELIPAPGAGKVNILESALFYFDYGTIQYTSGGDILIEEETSGTDLVSSFASSLITGTTNSIVYRPALSPSVSLTENKAINITNATGAFASGDGTLKVTLNYRVITL